MMELTRKGEYAIRGIIYLAQQPPGRVSLISEIAAAADVPQTFLAKIFQSFAKLGLVVSSRGTGGGFVLARPASAITMREVVEAVEGPILPNRCLLGASCERGTGHCLVHDVWRQVQTEVVNILDAVTIDTLARGRDGRDAA
ncbi:Rrf2 family transcriptional regulator [Geomonas sp. Red32]|uniref:RrF2 family transcriptional regulator n=1 Tax=Geomonas sp. Red32 TaxID=2912856 RepID=UPI00202CF909|nr:Rrf2 family transcriptional regulator [Geomonas sp. Red32]MCM0082008.1 Rrf2 family transcriptional regulator [Geomonas sp. Red32]